MSLFTQALDKYSSFKKSYSCPRLVESSALVIPTFCGVLACCLAVQSSATFFEVEGRRISTGKFSPLVKKFSQAGAQNVFFLVLKILHFLRLCISTDILTLKIFINSDLFLLRHLAISTASLVSQLPTNVI